MPDFLILMGLLGLMTLLWVISVPLRDVSIVDLFWGPGFVIVAWASYVISGTENQLALLLPILVSLWGVRLGIYLTYRNWGHGEDKRYAKMRERSGKAFTGTSLITVFWLQGFLMWLISFPLQLAIANFPTTITPLMGLGVAVWLIGFFFESVGDFQLARFKARADSDEVLRSGLWRYTRHPNYFGDFLVWWGYWLIAISGGQFYWTIISPIVMSVFLMFVSGVTMLEGDLKERKPKYKDYIESTNTFFPWFPKRSS